MGMAEPTTGPSTAGAGQAQEDRKLIKEGEPQQTQISPELLKLLVGAKKFREMTNPHKPSKKELMFKAAKQLNVENNYVVGAKSPESVLRKQQREARKAALREKKAARQNG